jgi:HlyD family secretion protein
VARGSFLNLGGRTAVFVVRGDVVRRTYVELGVASFETFEVTSGLAEGDEVVLSDMSDHRDLEEVRLK